MSIIQILNNIGSSFLVTKESKRVTRLILVLYFSIVPYPTSFLQPFPNVFFFPNSESGEVPGGRTLVHDQSNSFRAKFPRQKLSKRRGWNGESRKKYGGWKSLKNRWPFLENERVIRLFFLHFCKTKHLLVIFL